MATRGQYSEMAPDILNAWHIEATPKEKEKEIVLVHKKKIILFETGLKKIN